MFNESFHKISPPPPPPPQSAGLASHLYCMISLIPDAAQKLSELSYWQCVVPAVERLPPYAGAEGCWEAVKQGQC